MAEILFHAHSGLRYLVLLAGVLSAGYALVGLVGRKGWDRLGRIFLAAFVGTLHLQVVLGIVLAFLWRWYPQLIGHITLMVLAAASAQAALSVNKRRSPERQSHGLALAGTAFALALIVAGILAIERPVLG